MNVTVKQYLGSLKQDVFDLDILCDNELTSSVCHYILCECIEVLEDVKHPSGKNNYFIESKIDFLNQVLSELNRFKTSHPEEILTHEQIDKALKWYDNHRNHVNSLVNGVSKFPPSLNEDKKDCRLWKPQHWNWFLGYYN